MNAADKIDFAKVMVTLGESVSIEPTKEKTALYFKALEHFEILDIKNACLKVAQKIKFHRFPLISDIIDAVQGDQSLLAWTVAKEVAGEVGPQMSVVFEDMPIIHSVIKALGGWQHFCSIPVAKHSYLQKEFQDLYMLYLSRGAHPPQVGGIYPTEDMTMNCYTATLDRLGRVCCKPGAPALRQGIESNGSQIEN